MSDRLIRRVRYLWNDDYDSTFRLLEACCDLLTVIDGDLTGHRIPAAVDYRPAAGFSLRHMVEDEDGTGTEYDWVWLDAFVMEIADELGFEVLHNGETDEPDLHASVDDWNQAPDLLLSTINRLHVVIEVLRAAGRDT